MQLDAITFLDKNKKLNKNALIPSYLEKNIKACIFINNIIFIEDCENKKIIWPQYSQLLCITD